MILSVSSEKLTQIIIGWLRIENLVHNFSYSLKKWDVACFIHCLRNDGFYVRVLLISCHRSSCNDIFGLAPLRQYDLIGGRPYSAFRSNFDNKHVYEQHQKTLVDLFDTTLRLCRGYDKKCVAGSKHLMHALDIIVCPIIKILIVVVISICHIIMLGSLFHSSCGFEYALKIIRPYPVRLWRIKNMILMLHPKHNYKFWLLLIFSKYFFFQNESLKNWNKTEKCGFMQFIHNGSCMTVLDCPQ